MTVQWIPGTKVLVIRSRQRKYSIVKYHVFTKCPERQKLKQSLQSIITKYIFFNIQYLTSECLHTRHFPTKIRQQSQDTSLGFKSETLFCSGKKKICSTSLGKMLPCQDSMTAINITPLQEIIIETNHTSSKNHGAIIRVCENNQF